MKMDLQAASRGVEVALYGWRRYAIEAPLIAAGLVVLDAFVFGGARFAGVEPSPFWIVVILTAVQYGSLGGVWGAICATAALHLGAAPGDASGDFYVRAAEFARAPFLWLGFALTAGGLRTLQIAQMSATRDALNDARAREAIVSDGMRRAVAEIERLETRIAGDLRTADDLLEAAAALFETHAFNSRSAAEFAATAIGADLSLLRFVGDGVEEVGSVGFVAPGLTPLCRIELSLGGTPWGFLAVWRLGEHTSMRDANSRAEMTARVVESALSQGARASARSGAQVA